MKIEPIITRSFSPNCVACDYSHVGDYETQLGYADEDLEYENLWCTIHEKVVNFFSTICKDYK